MGGPTLRASSRQTSPWICATPLANRGNHGNRTLANSANTPPLGVGPEAHGPPLAGGGNTLARGSRGEHLPGCSLVILPRWPPPLSGTIRGSRRAFLAEREPYGEYY